MTDAERRFETICVVGLGYVGLPTAAVLANRGFSVIGVDTNERTVDLINDGAVHIVEPDLDILVHGAVATGNLRAATAPEPADAFIIAVPTPFRQNHEPDLSCVEAAARRIAPLLKRGDLVIVESTCPVGATERVADWIAEERDDLKMPRQDGTVGDVFIAHSPERVLPGQVLLELVRNDRVVGGISPACAERAADLYRLVITGRCLTTNARTAELVKLAENAYRDTNIAFANELSMVCDRLGIDVWDVIDMANHHPRVDILRPGPGVGGHCIAVDPWFIIDSAPEETPLMQTARRVNDAKPAHVVGKIAEALALSGGRTVAGLGLAYKANIDDLRESPAVEIVRILAEQGYRVLAVEPNVDALPDRLLDNRNIELTDATSALAAADVIALLVDHDAFRDIDGAARGNKPVVDTRGFWR